MMPLDVTLSLSKGDAGRVMLRQAQHDTGPTSVSQLNAQGHDMHKGTREKHGSHW
jgi:hypothetical protein